MWLAIVSPVVSQTLASRANALTGWPICSEHESGAAPAPAAPSVVVANQPGADPHQPAGMHLSVCGYCGLLAHHLPIAAPTVALLIRDVIATSLSRAIPPTVFAIRRYDAFRPRAPPDLLS